MNERSASGADGSSRGLRAILLYKAVKAGVQLAVALLAVALWPLGLPAQLRELAIELHRHIASGWAASLAAWLEQSATPRRIELSLLALGGDGALTAVEAWAVSRRRWWGPWLVVFATGAVLPFELFELARSARPSRAVLLAINVAVVVYLARHALRARARQPAPPSPEP